MADNSILTGSNNEDFFITIDNAIEKLKELDNITTSAKSNIQGYARSFNSLNRELKSFASAGKNMNNSANRGSSSSSGSSSNAQNKNSGAEQEVEKITNSIQKSAIDSFNDIFSAVSNLGGNTKGISSILKTSGRLVSSAVKTGTKLNGVMGAAVSTGAKVAGVLGLIVAALAAMSEAGKAAYERNININRSLMQMGESSKALKDASIETANQARDIKHEWIIIGQKMQDIFQPVYKFFLNIAKNFTDAIYDLTGSGNGDSEKFNSANVGSRTRWYTSMLQDKYYEPESTSVPIINSIAGTARQSGFDLTSAINLGIGTYDAAFKLAQKYGLEAADIAEQLASAWQSGSDAAKEYGVVVNDTVLAGYLADKGIDIVNVQISDAMKEYYRYQLMQEELSAGSQDAIQDQVKAWTKLGMEIEATKNKLFSFDEVINLQAIDTTIPTVGLNNIGDGYNTPDKKPDDDIENEHTPDINDDKRDDAADNLDDAADNLDDAADNLDDAADNLDDAADNLDDAANDLKDAADNLDDAADNLDDAADNLDDAANDLKDAADTLKNAINEMQNNIEVNLEVTNNINTFEDNAEQIIDSLNNVDTDNVNSLNNNTNKIISAFHNIINKSTQEVVQAINSAIISGSTIIQIIGLLTTIRDIIKIIQTNNKNREAEKERKIQERERDIQEKRELRAEEVENRNIEKRAQASINNNEQTQSHVSSHSNTQQSILGLLNPADVILEYLDTLGSYAEKKGGTAYLKLDDFIKAVPETLIGYVDSIVKDITNIVNQTKKDGAKGFGNALFGNIKYALTDMVGDFMNLGALFENVIIERGTKNTWDYTNGTKTIGSRKNYMEDMGSTDMRGWSLLHGDLEKISKDTQRMLTNTWFKTGDEISLADIIDSNYKGKLVPNKETGYYDYYGYANEDFASINKRNIHAQTALEIGMQFDEDQFNNLVENLKIFDEKFKIEVEADTKKADTDINNLTNKADKINDKSIIAKIDAKTDNKKIEDILNELDTINNKKTTAEVETKTDTKKIKDILNELDTINNKKTTAEVDAHTLSANSAIKNTLLLLSETVNKKWNTKLTATDEVSNKVQNIFNFVQKLLSSIGSFFGNGILSSAGNIMQNMISSNSQKASTTHFASGGIGTHEINNATLFENNKKEAVIPLESQSGIDYLASALREAQGNGGLDGGSSVTINLSLNGIFDTDDRGKWEQLAEKMAETMQVQMHRRGDLAYGANY